MWSPQPSTMVSQLVYRHCTVIFDVSIERAPSELQVHTPTERFGTKKSKESNL